MTVDPCADHVSDLLEEIRDKDRVIARLLDGWHANPRAKTWVRTKPDQRNVTIEQMSDGDAAIIRAHQDRT
jgi:hypothetical protein